MILTNRKTPGRKKRCSTDGCGNCRLEELRYCGKCANRITREMKETGYLCPEQREIQFFHDNGVRKIYW